MCSHKCLPVAAEDNPRDKAMLLTIILEWTAQTLSNTILQGAISQEPNTVPNTVGDILVMLDV